MNNIFDLYTDYLQISLGLATATGLSRLMDNSVSHDQVTRMLSNTEFDNKELWINVKAIVRQHETDDACLIFDDSIAHKPYTDENEIICWHYDHCSGTSVKGMNILTMFYHTQKYEQALKVPLAIEIIHKYPMCDLKTKKEHRKSTVNKNELLRKQIKIALKNQVKFSFVLADSWYSSAENMRFIHDKKKYFIFDLKSNRKATLGDRNKPNWTNVSLLELQANTPTLVWLKDVELPILLFKQVFTNKDNSTGVRYLVSNKLDLTSNDFISIYHKRWSVEEYHKSFKQNVCMEKSPTRTVKTQKTHVFASLVAYIKLERYKFSTGLNHFAQKGKLFLNATKLAFQDLQKLKAENEAYEKSLASA